LAAGIVLPLILACSLQSTTETTLASLPLDAVHEILTRSGVEADPNISADGQGSIRVRSDGEARVRLIELDLPPLDASQIIYRAKLRSEALEGKAYLEMWCRFDGLGEFFSRALDAPVSGTTEWVSQQTPFFLAPGQRPSLVKLNLVVEGSGTVWIDAASLASVSR
jgi:hypothetical protein